MALKFDTIVLTVNEPITDEMKQSFTEETRQIIRQNLIDENELHEDDPDPFEIKVSVQLH